MTRSSAKVLPSATGRAVSASSQLAPTARYKTSATLRAGSSVAVEVGTFSGEAPTETSPKGAVPHPALAPLTVAPRRPVGQAVRRTPPVLRTAARLGLAAAVVLGLHLAASNVWTAIPLAVLLVVVCILIPSEDRNVDRSS